MTLAKSCPGSRAVREPTPEYINCPNCGAEVEVWTHEVSRACSACGTRVFREQRPSCIDWCPFAEQCIGPQVYASLKSPKETKSGSGPATALDLLEQDHEEATKQIDMLRAGALCLRIGASAQLSQVPQTLDKGLERLGKALAFFDGDLKRHFAREEEDIFPILEKRIGKQGNPTQVLLAEHAELWQWHGRLKEKLAELDKVEGEGRAAIANEINDIVGHIETLLRGHIEKENTSLLPLTRGILREGELQAITDKWRSPTAQNA